LAEKNRLHSITDTDYRPKKFFIEEKLYGLEEKRTYSRGKLHRVTIPARLCLAWQAGWLCCFIDLAVEKAAAAAGVGLPFTGSGW
jgi:hypothetical protein